RHHRFRDRDIVPDAIYTINSTDPTGSQENLAATLAGDDRDLVRALATACMLGGMYAEYVCRTAGADKTVPASKADPGPLFAAVNLLFHQVKHPLEPVPSTLNCE